MSRRRNVSDATIAVVMAFILDLVQSPDKIIDYISSIVSGAIVMLTAYVSLLFLYNYAKNQVKETVKEPEENKDGSDV